jgi:hypothetical protein
MSWKNEVFDRLGFRKKPLFQRWTDKLFDAVEDATGSVERTGGRAAKVAGSAHRRTGEYLSEARERTREAGGRARERARARRDAVAERIDAISERAAEIRERRQERRQYRSERRKRRRRARVDRRAPMQLDVSGDDRVVLRGRRSVNLRTPDGEVIRYRYYESPGFARRLLLHLTGRRIWPPR